MARAVVLFFENNQDAEAYIAHESFLRNTYEFAPDEIVGVYPVPTMFCDPSDPIHKGKGKTGRGYTKGLKYGWWVCAVCKKPSGRNSNRETLVRSVVSQAVNMLDQIRGDGDPKGIAS